MIIPVPSISSIVKKIITIHPFVWHPFNRTLIKKGHPVILLPDALLPADKSILPKVLIVYLSKTYILLQEYHPLRSDKIARGDTVNINTARNHSVQLVHSIPHNIVNTRLIYFIGYEYFNTLP